MKDKNEKRHPRKGAGRRLAARLKELGQKPPLKELTEKINQYGEKEREKVASSRDSLRDARAE